MRHAPKVIIGRFSGCAILRSCIFKKSHFIASRLPTLPSPTGGSFTLELVSTWHHPQAQILRKAKPPWPGASAVALSSGFPRSFCRISPDPNTIGSLVRLVPPSGASGPGGSHAAYPRTLNLWLGSETSHPGEPDRRPRSDASRAPPLVGVVNEWWRMYVAGSDRRPAIRASRSRTSCRPWPCDYKKLRFLKDRLENFASYHRI